MRATKDFKPAGEDQWKNKFVYCPVCKVKCKEDGAIKHIIRSGVVGDIAHSIWLNKNYKPVRKQRK